MQFLEVRTVPIDSLEAASYNPRSISEAALAGLSESMRRFGVVQPVVWNERTGRIVGGHQRVRVLRAEGATEVQVVVVTLDETEERALNVALNNPAISGEFTDELQTILRDVQAADAELFDALMLDELVTSAKVGPDSDADGPDDDADAFGSIFVELGDVWQLGKHRIACGDSTSPDVVGAVLQGDEPPLMVTDPPYGVQYDASWRAVPGAIEDRAVGPVLNDERADWREAWALFPGQVAYVWHADIYTATVHESLDACGLDARALIIWDKGRMVFGRGNYHHEHEPCWYMVRKGATARWRGGRKQTTVWRIPKPRKSETGHSTQKPIECMARPIRNHTTLGELVYEPFSGSGTTIIACEQEQRVCRAIELNPAYVELAIRRWESLTGEQAVRESDGAVLPVSEEVESDDE